MNNDKKSECLHSTINRWSSRTKTMRYLYHKFVDGVHPSPELPNIVPGFYINCWKSTKDGCTIN
jgi:hypothetical protein